MPESQDAIQQVVDLMDNGQMAPYEVLSESKGTDLFVSGQAGVVFVGSWKASVLEDSKLAQDGNVQLIQMPAMAKNNYCTMGGLGYVMSEKCKNKEAAWEFIRYISGEEAETHELRMLMLRTLRIWMLRFLWKQVKLVSPILPMVTLIGLLLWMIPCRWLLRKSRV